MRLIDADALWDRTFSCEDAADVRKEIEIAPTVDASPCWVQVEDKLPQPYERVLVCCMTKKGIQTQNLAYFADGFWHGQGSMSGVTHWMSLPMPPKNGGNAL